MKYFFIVLAIIVVLSPLMWLRPSPGQLRRTRLRARAAAIGLRVQLVPAVDAAADEKQPDSVRYLLPGGDAQHRPLIGTFWILVRSGRRGWESPWVGWRWLRAEAPVSVQKALTDAVERLPADVTGICCDSQGVSVYWDEQGAESQVDSIYEILNDIKQKDKNVT